MNYPSDPVAAAIAGAYAITPDRALDLIQSIDRILTDLRKQWLRSTTAEAPRVWLLIDQALDERLALMALC